MFSYDEFATESYETSHIYTSDIIRRDALSGEANSVFEWQKKKKKKSEMRDIVEVVVINIMTGKVMNNLKELVCYLGGFGISENIS